MKQTFNLKKSDGVWIRQLLVAIIISVFSLLHTSIVYGSIMYKPQISTPGSKQENKGKTKVAFTKQNDGNKRISFILGVGASHIITDHSLYQDPVIDKATNFVVFDKAQEWKSGIAIGIAYTPYLYEIDDEIVPRGVTAAAFFTPLALNGITSDLTPSNVDCGFGLGWKFFSGFMILGTVECFNLRQPKKSFADQYKGNDRHYIINNSTQLALDPKDGSIFTTELGFSVGIKCCYTFDIIKNYHAKSAE